MKRHWIMMLVVTAALTSGCNPSGQQTPTETVAVALTACKAKDYAALRKVWTGNALHVGDPTIAAFCDHVTAAGTVKQLVITAESDGAGGTRILKTNTWLDADQTKPGPAIEWLLRQEEGRWVLMGGN